MALTGEFIPTDLTIEYSEPGTPATFFDVSQYVNDVKRGWKIGEADTTSYGTKDKTSIPGLGENELSFTLRYNNTPAAASRPQTKLKAMAAARNITGWRIRDLGIGTGKPEQTFQAFITGFDEEKANDDKVVSASVKLRITGSVTETLQT